MHVAHHAHQLSPAGIIEAIVIVWGLLLVLWVAVERYIGKQ